MSSKLNTNIDPPTLAKTVVVCEDERKETETNCQSIGQDVWIIVLQEGTIFYYWNLRFSQMFTLKQLYYPVVWTDALFYVKLSAPRNLGKLF